MLLATIPSFAGESLQYHGEQTLLADTVWDGEVLIDGILTVPVGVTLEIRPGSRVRFTRFDSNGDGIGEHEIFCQGTIRALGTAAAPILFSSAETAPRPGDWGAVNMMASEQDNQLEHCIVEYGYRGFHAHFARARLRQSLFRYNQRGAQFQESRVLIEGCELVDNTNGLQFRDSQVELRDSLVARNQWGVRCVYSEVQISGCLVADNLVNGINLRDSKLVVTGNRVVDNRRGLYLQRSQGLVQGNLLADNSEHGIFLEETKAEVVDNQLSGNGRAGVRWLNSSGRLARNNIVDNGEYGLINDGLEPVDARFNWWGDPAAAMVAKTVRDGRTRPGLGLADSRSALTQPLTLPLPEGKVP